MGSEGATGERVRSGWLLWMMLSFVLLVSILIGFCFLSLTIHWYRESPREGAVALVLVAVFFAFYYRANR